MATYTCAVCGTLALPANSNLVDGERIVHRGCWPPTDSHTTHIEFTGSRYYWWCQHPDCDRQSRLFVNEADCADFATQHERDAKP